MTRIPIPESGVQPLDELHLLIPGTPPNLNHYVRHTRNGSHYKTDASKRFVSDVAVMLKNRFVIGQAFQVDAVIYLGPKQKGDVDGFGKVLLDALAATWVFRRRIPKGAHLQVLSDAHVVDFRIRKFRDVANPRTEVTVRAIELLET
ncbi:MAG TPA: hypothetical protein VKY85_07515 [Candidatus Angelobacter sp.]|nr:hypothetical protein [Candidatus Angelobacter sp.]